MQPKVRRRKEIIKNRAELNEIEKRLYKKLMQQTAYTLQRNKRGEIMAPQKYKGSYNTMKDYMPPNSTT